MRRYTQDERREIVSAFKASGMTQRQFAQTNGVNFHTLQHWLHYKPKRAKAKGTKPRFVEVAPTSTRNAPVRVHLCADLEVSLAELPPPVYLVELARALVAAAC